MDAAAAGVSVGAAGVGVAAGAAGGGAEGTFGLETITTMNLLSSIEYSERGESSASIFPEYISFCPDAG